jgi:hypothetical protein
MILIMFAEKGFRICEGSKSCTGLTGHTYKANSSFKTSRDLEI